MDNTKTAEEKPDFRKMYPGEPINDNAHRRVEGYVWGCEKIWDDYVTPLKKRIEELEDCGSDILKFKASLIRIVEMKFDDPSECSAAFERLSQLINPSTNGKQ